MILFHRVGALEVMAVIRGTGSTAIPLRSPDQFAHQSASGSGSHQHYFDWATQTLPIAVGEVLYAYVYLDPANLPTEIMVQWNNGTWEHRAYWGANSIEYV